MAKRGGLKLGHLPRRKGEAPLEHPPRARSAAAVHACSAVGSNDGLRIIIEGTNHLFQSPSCVLLESAPSLPLVKMTRTIAITQ
jgi:hypothetical protein